MADPTAYTVGYDFSGFADGQPGTPLPGVKVDIELANIQTAISSLVGATKDVRRSDGALKNSIVTVDSLSDTVKKLLGVNSTDLQTVADAVADVSAVAGVIDDVSTVAGVSADVTTVAGIATDVTEVAGISTSVSAVAEVAGDVTSVAGIADDVSAVADDLANINLKLAKSANLSDLADADTALANLAGGDAATGTGGLVREIGAAIDLTNATGLASLASGAGVLPGLNGGVAQVTSNAALAAIDTTKNTVACLNGAEFVWSGNVDLSAQVTMDTHAVLYVPPTGQSGSTGAWVRTLYGAVLFAWWNAPVHGSGLTAEGQLDSAIALSASLMVPLYVDGKVYDLAAVNSLTELGSTRYYALHPVDNMDVVGVKDVTTFRMADAQSTSGAPKDCNIFTTNIAHVNHSLTGIIFDLNSANNSLGTGSSANFGSYYVTGNSATITGLWITTCQFINGPGTNQIVVGQQTIDTTLSDDVHIWDNYFHNNGLQVSDHATVYLWCSNAWLYGNRFQQDDALSPVGFNWVCWENHGPHQFCYGNTASNYVKLTNTASNWNATEGVHDIHIYDNSITTYFNGPNLYIGGSAATPSAVYDVFIHHNEIALKAPPSGFVAGPVGISAQILTGSSGKLYNIFCDSNHIFALATTGYAGAVYGCSIGCPDGTSIKNWHFTNNRVEGTGYGFYARLNDGEGTLDNIVETGNTYIGLADALSTGIAFGSVFQQGGTSVIGKVITGGNHYIPTPGVAWSWGQFLAGNIAVVVSDNDNDYEPGLTNYNFADVSINNSATIDRRKGRQLCSGGAIPTSGTFDVGAWWYNSAPAASGTGYWACITGGTFGTLSGVTGSITSGSPTLTVSSAASLLVGQYITIAGVSGTFKIKAISGTTVTLNANAGATVSGAAVAWSAPVFKASALAA